MSKDISNSVDWTVLLIGGPSGAGKSIVARQIGLHLGFPWLEVDDLRLALQSSRVTLPQETESLYYFTDTPNIWQRSPERLNEGLIAVGEVMAPAIEIVVANHCDNAGPIIVEGDGILPLLAARPLMKQYLTSGQARMVLLVEPDEQVLYTNMVTRGRVLSERTESELRTEARAKWLYGQWLTEEAQRYSIPVLTSRPWETLLERIMEAVSVSLY
jgi:2-phosphoglycerate kinase